MIKYKLIGDRREKEIINSLDFLFGFEESCGYLAGRHARDKDAVVASMLFAEMVCYYQSLETSVVNVLNSLYEKYGYVVEDTVSIKYEGITATGTSWQQVKLNLLKNCKAAKKPIDTRLPMIRCSWHAEGKGADSMAPFLNVSTTGNSYLSRSDWKNGVDI